MAVITPAQSITSQTLPVSPDLYRFTVHEYERMVLDDPQVELINGYVVRKMGKKPPHVWAVDSVEEWLRARLSPGWCVRRENPVRIPDFDEPEPDVAVARGSARPTAIVIQGRRTFASSSRRRKRLTIGTEATNGSRMPGPASLFTGSSTSSRDGSRFTLTPGRRATRRVRFSRLARQRPW